jgi:hypothetical protein
MSQKDCFVNVVECDSEPVLLIENTRKKLETGDSSDNSDDIFSTEGEDKAAPLKEYERLSALSAEEVQRGRKDRRRGDLRNG